jgi:hypothetical protein
LSTCRPTSQADDSLPHLRLPERPTDAIGGAEFARKIEALPPEAREDQISKQIMAGNVPSFIRRLVPVPVTEDQAALAPSAAGASGGTTTTASAVLRPPTGGSRPPVAPASKLNGVIFVTPTYLAVGTDDDYLLVPMTPYTAQRIADKLHCILPTPKMVDAIYSAAEVKLPPSPIPPSPAMTTVPVFLAHSQTVILQRRAEPKPLSSLTAGIKKDIVICRELADNPGHVAIYGWQTPDKKPIQPLYLGHNAAWTDYSHGVRLVSDTMMVNGEYHSVTDVLREPTLCGLLSNEGPILQPRYNLHHFPRNGYMVKTPAGERFDIFTPAPGVRGAVDTPTTLQQRVEVIVYALPNGNTIEETFGKKKDPDDDFHFDIQHIGAQTRFLREAMPNESVVVVYLEASNHSWPAWLREHPKPDASEILEAIRARFPDRDVHFTLDSHSGGGAFLFGYIQAVKEIPIWIDRIAFIDSEYNYDLTLHEAKLAAWLKLAGRSLCAIAYDDASALLNGKAFVTPQGGTWGRTHAMLSDLSKEFPIAEVGKADPSRFVGLGGRVVFLLKENPKREILHTVQVERNGFIESILSGTNLEEKDYHYFGPRAYAKFIGD